MSISSSNSSNVSQRIESDNFLKNMNKIDIKSNLIMKKKTRYYYKTYDSSKDSLDGFSYEYAREFDSNTKEFSYKSFASEKHQK